MSVVRTDVPAIATVTGYAMSDLWIEADESRGHYRISMASQSKELVEDLARALREIGFDGKEGRPEPQVNYNEAKDVWQVNLASEELYRWITELTRDDVRRIARQWPREYLRAVFDGDGSVSEIRPGRLSVRYGTSAKWLVDLFAELLREVRGYQVTQWKSGDIWYAAVNNQDQVWDFLDWVKPIYKVPKE